MSPNPPNEPSSTPLADVVERELDRVDEEARVLWDRWIHLDERERRTLADLWEYGKRLRFLHVFAAMADPRQPLDARSLARIQKQFQRAVIAYGSATEDNVRAASSTSLTLRGATRGRRVLALQSGTPPMGLEDVLLHALHIVGTKKFYDRHLRKLPGLEHVSSATWEDAYRAVMLTACALFTRPRHRARARTGNARAATGRARRRSRR
jgi:hypothetical protein